MNTKKRLLICFFCLFMYQFACGQIEYMKIDGYIQADFEISDKDGTTFLGPAHSEAKDGNSDYYFRYGLYRGVITAKFEKDKSFGMLRVNFTEAGVMPLVACFQYNMYDWLGFQAGLSNIDYGFELMYPSIFFETIERSAFTRLLFPKEHDLGFKFILSYPSKDRKNKLSLSLGMTSGNGINKIADKHMNFLSHLKYNYTGEVWSLGMGASYYEGKTNNTSDSIYKVKNHAWQVETTSENQKNARRYFNFEFQVGYKSDVGISTLRGETSFGLQPSRKNNFASQDNNSYNPLDAFSYQRHFLGYTFYFIQKFYKFPISLVGKYSYFDKNTKLSENEITNIHDICMQNIGFGLIWDFNPNMRAYLFYDMNSNETNNIFKQLDDDVLHLRLQYAF